MSGLRIEAERQRNIDLVVKGVIGDDDARERIAELQARRFEAEAELANLEEAPSTLTLHPTAIEKYVETVDALAAVLAHHAEANDDRGALVNSFRALVHSVTIHPKGSREGFEIEVEGKLAPPSSAGTHSPKRVVLGNAWKPGATGKNPLLRTIVGLGW
jgi:site-specific DNA recombinase